jgi:lipid A 4'-phosphatase
MGMNGVVEQARTFRDLDSHHHRQGIWLPLLVLAGLSVVFHFTQMDVALEHLFWSPTDGWRWANRPVVRFLYEYGTWPAAIVGGGGTLLWLGSLATGRWQAARPVCLFLALLLVLGPGLVINVGLKDHTGRSRPKQVKEFGGNQPYRPLGELGPRDGGSSFPSGHASMGFYWLGLAIYFRAQRRNWAWGFAALGLTHGLLMGLGRMAQGGHWLSDIFWSAGVIYLIAWGLNWLFNRSRSESAPLRQFAPALARRFRTG